MASQFTPTAAEFLVLVLFGALVAALTTAWARSRAAVALAVAHTERDAHAARVSELTEAAADLHSTATLLAPVQQALGRMERQVGLLERDRMEQFGLLGERLTEVSASTTALGAQTSSLAGALNASTIRGSWGELQLRRILEHSGLLARCDFDEQVAAVSSHGARVRPDVVVRLPGDRALVIDAKCPMSAFLAAQRPDLEPEGQQVQLRRHAGALRGHVESLAAKTYWSAFTRTPQMVVCFVPSDAVLAAALVADPALYDDALARRVVLASPATLMALLRTVAFVWQQDAAAENAQQVLALSRELYARLSTTSAHLGRMGGALRRAVESYNALVGTLESRVLVTTRRLEDLGVVEGQCAEVNALEITPRPLSAAELIDAVDAEHRRPELLLPSPGAPPDPHVRPA
ncbi:MAG: DNA recombination protein RmuC [Austwickia sp.]|nr:DNA recombination protein RmuC [Austwickia sp.]